MLTHDVGYSSHSRGGEAQGEEGDTERFSRGWPRLCPRLKPPVLRSELQGFDSRIGSDPGSRNTPDRVWFGEILVQNHSCTRNRKVYLGGLVEGWYEFAWRASEEISMRLSSE